MVRSTIRKILRDEIILKPFEHRLEVSTFFFGIGLNQVDLSPAFPLEEFIHNRAILAIYQTGPSICWNDIATERCRLTL